MYIFLTVLTARENVFFLFIQAGSLLQFKKDKSAQLTILFIFVFNSLNFFTYLSFIANYELGIVSYLFINRPSTVSDF